MTSSSLKRILAQFEFSKKSLDWLHKTTKDFKSGFIAGLFYADGHVDFNESSRSVSFRISSSEFANLQNVQLILQELGVFSRIADMHPEGETLLPDGKGGRKMYATRASYRLIIGGVINCLDSVPVMFNYTHAKSEKFDRIISTIERRQDVRRTSRVKSVEFHSKQDVYCLEENNRRTLIAEGMTARRCFEIGFVPVTEDGVCGVQFCNLTSMNGRLLTTKENFKKATWAATLIGTLQATYTDFPYLGNTAEFLTKEEALLGVSITGMMENPHILLDPDIQREMAEYAIEVNKDWAQRLGIKPAARVTCVKPEGTSSLVLGTSSGIHAHHSRQYLRRVQCNKLDNVYQHLAKTNPHISEESVWSAIKSDDVVAFPLTIPEQAMVKADLNALKHLDIIKSTQKNWVLTGTAIKGKPVTHNVSCTVIVKDDEWSSVVEYLFNNREFFSAVSLLGEAGDKTYAQAPMESVQTEADVERFNRYLKDFKEVDYSTMLEAEDHTALKEEVACAGGACEIITLN